MKRIEYHFNINNKKKRLIGRAVLETHTGIYEVVQNIIMSDGYIKSTVKCFTDKEEMNKLVKSLDRAFPLLDEVELSLLETFDNF